jgi:hypothetical protein
MKTVEDLKALTPKGETRVFSPSIEAGLAAASFYWVATSGEFLYTEPQWLNRPRTEERPRPSMWGLGPIALSEMAEPLITFNGTAKMLSDFYRMDTTLYMLSQRLTDLILERDRDFGETRPVRIRFADESGAPAEYYMLLPTRQVDAVDTSRTEVIVESKNVPKGSERFVTHVHFNKGFILRDDVLAEVQTFVEPHTHRWMWRPELLEAAGKVGAIGLYGEHPFDRAERTRFRL